MEVPCTVHSSASAARTASSTTCEFKTGSAPGRARQTGQVLEFGGAPKLVEQQQKIFVRVLSCTCTSSPTTISYRPLDVSECCGAVAELSVIGVRRPRGRAPAHRPRGRSAPP